MGKLYDCDYTEISGTVRLYKYDVPLPKMPAEEEMENYGLPIEEQKWLSEQATLERTRKEQERNAKWMAEHAEEWAEKKAQQFPSVDGVVSWSRFPFVDGNCCAPQML